MPKATRKKSEAAQKVLPYQRRTIDTSTSTAVTDRTEAHDAKDKKSVSKAKQRDPKASHLFTDDNPSTTLHGTGFKDAATAHHTLDIISQRSLTYQWRVVNTMYHRAMHHPARKRWAAEAGAGIGPKRSSSKDHSPLGSAGASMDSTTQTQGRGFDDAMAIFHTWLNTTYPHAKQKRKDHGREFKPILSRGVVTRCLDRIRGVSDDAARFAEMYSRLPKGKRLANVLVDEAEPGGRDWDIMREIELSQRVQEREGRCESGEKGLWRDKGGCSDWHLRCIGWAWSPVGERRLPP